MNGTAFAPPARRPVAVPAPAGAAAGQAGVVLALAVLAMLALGSCSTNNNAAGARQAQAPGRVLVLTRRLTPLLSDVLGALAAGGQGSPPLPPVAADIEFVNDAAEATAAVRRRLPQLAGYRAIVSNGQTFARAAQLVAPQVPIVFSGIDDPVALCLVDSLERPGRNATGFMAYLERDDFKMIELLHDAYPALRDIKLLVSGDNIGPPNCDPADPYWTTPPATDCTPGERPLAAYVQRRVRGAQLAAYAASRGLRLRFVVVCGTRDFAALAGSGARGGTATGAAGGGTAGTSGTSGTSGWLVSWQSLFDNNRQPLVRALNASREPAIYHHDGYVQMGGLMALTVLRDDGLDRAWLLALQRVLGGADPATLPVQTPRGFSLIVNAATAEQLPVRPSLLLLRRADRIVQ